MSDQRLARAAACLAVMAAGVSLGCKVDKQAFEAKLFGCNPNAADPACGTDAQNKPMACVPAYQLGGRNFCATGCDANSEAPEGPDAICLPSGPKEAGLLSGAHLPRCNPGLANDCGREELSCLRTDLLNDEGVCMTVNSCKSDSDCRDPVRAKCMGELLSENYSKAELKADHTYCLQEGCRARRTACSPGETCLRDVLAQSSNPSDICVPNCDANRNCPPNYFCFPDLYSRASPPVCIPGLLGLRCRSKLDCLFGDCVPTGIGFNICSVPCDSDDVCAKYDSEYGQLFCAKDGPSPGWCTGARAFRGATCVTTEDCRYDGEVCAHAGSDVRTGQCLHPCAPLVGTCPSYGGVAHACRPQYGADGQLDLFGDPWICWPGYFGMLCKDDTNCIESLSCLNANPATAIYKVCTNPCQNDDDCTQNRHTPGGWCDPKAHVCAAPLPDDDPRCDRDRQCESKKCIVFGAGHKCDKTPGW
jgi:hypothetical protein